MEKKCQKPAAEVEMAGDLAHRKQVINKRRAGSKGRERGRGRLRNRNKY
jgi:hypothetical protein